MKLMLENRDIGTRFRPVLVATDENGQERLFGLTEIDENGIVMWWPPAVSTPKERELSEAPIG